MQGGSGPGAHETGEYALLAALQVRVWRLRRSAGRAERTNAGGTPEVCSHWTHRVEYTMRTCWRLAEDVRACMHTCTLTSSKHAYEPHCVQKVTKMQKRKEKRQSSTPCINEETHWSEAPYFRKLQLCMKCLDHDRKPLAMHFATLLAGSLVPLSW